VPSKSCLTIDVLTLFPKTVEVPLSESILKIAQRKKLANLRVHNLRRWTRDRHKKCDDKPFGGGPGMVMMIEPIDQAIRTLKKKSPKAHVIYLSPHGKRFDQRTAHRLAKAKHLILLCGHYEGIDQRAVDHLVDEELSIGDFVLTGGELAALCVIDAVVRLLPGVLGNCDSLAHESFEKGRLDFPHYTRPREYGKWKVPEVLFSGDHRAIDAWREKESLRLTEKHRPDLLK
jgi:tRNA (guanine37-N1)-methyltransferase